MELHAEQLHRGVEAADIDKAARFELVAAEAVAVGLQRGFPIDAAHQISPMRWRDDLLGGSLEIKHIQRVGGLRQIALLDGVCKGRDERQQRTGGQIPQKLAAIGHARIIFAAQSSCSRTRGTTFVPYSSMLDMSLSCGSVPLLYLRSKRDSPSTLIVLTIFAATVSGEPTYSEPSGPASFSKCARPIGGQPRSAPIRFISPA